MSTHVSPTFPELLDTYSRFQRVVQALESGPPIAEVASFGEFLMVRAELFDVLGLPLTQHNSLRLYDCAAMGFEVGFYLQDVDVHLPMSWRDDEARFASALAAHCERRALTDLEARVYDATALLELPHHHHNHAAVRAWLEAQLPYVAMRLYASNDDHVLERAVC